jgi:hypothetical protein
MACSLLRNLALVGIGLVLGAGWSAFGEPAPRQYWHEGRAIEHEARKPLDASVVAWPEMKRSSMNGSCPAYGSKALDTQTSHDGGFKISIDQSQRTYTLVYCLNDFVPRVDFMPNRRNGTAVEPTPAELWPVKIESGASESFDIQVGRTVIGLLNNLSYLMTVDENRFAESINRLASDFSDTSSGRAATIRNVRALASSWNTGNAQ